MTVTTALASIRVGGVVIVKSGWKPGRFSALVGYPSNLDDGIGRDGRVDSVKSDKPSIVRTQAHAFFSF